MVINSLFKVIHRVALTLYQRSIPDLTGSSPALPLCDPRIRFYPCISAVS